MSCWKCGEAKRALSSPTLFGHKVTICHHCWNAWTDFTEDDAETSAMVDALHRNETMWEARKHVGDDENAWLAQSNAKAFARKLRDIAKAWIPEPPVGP